MASKYEISAIFKMIDNFTGPINRIAGSSSAFAKKFSADMQKTQMQIKAAGAAMKKMAGLAAAAGVALAGKTIVDSAKLYMDFEGAVAAAGSKFKDLDVTSDTYNSTLEELQKSAREVGKVTKFSASDAAGALDKFAMAGFTSEQSMAMLMGTTNLASATGYDLTSAVDMATDAMGAFQLVSDDPTIMADNMDHLSDVVAKTTNAANLDMGMWFESVKMGAPTFTSLGGTIDQFSAIVGTLANSGIKGSQAGNELKNMMLNLSAPAKAGADALNKLGISVFDDTGKMLPFIDIMKQFETNLDGMADEEKADLLKKIFGKEQIGAFNILLAEGSEKLSKFTDEIKNSSGTAAAVANAQNQSFQGLIATLKSAVEDKMLDLGKAFEVGGAKDALQGLTEFIQNMDMSSIADFLANLMQSIPTVISNFANFIKILWDCRAIIMGVVIAMGAYKAILIVANIAQGIMNATTAVKAAMDGTATATQTALNLAMNACPVMLIVTAIGALIGAIVMLIQNWDKVKSAFAAAWNWITTVAVPGIGNFFKMIGEKIAWVWEAITSAIGAMWETIKGFFAMVWEGVKSLAGSVVSALLSPVQKFLELLSHIPLLGDFIGGGAKKLEEFRNFAANGFADPVTNGERTAYSVSENNTNSTLTIQLPPGVSGSLATQKGAPPISIQQTHSAGYF